MMMKKVIFDGPPFLALPPFDLALLVHTPLAFVPLHSKTAKHELKWQIAS